MAESYFAETTSVFSSLKVAPPGFSPVRFGFDRVVCHTNAFFGGVFAAETVSAYER